MTYQIGVACAEGVLLASDRKVTNLSGYRRGLLTPKIEVLANFAHCSAGDAFCDVFTTEIRDELAKQPNFPDGTLQDVRLALVNCVDRARDKEAKFRRERNEVSKRPIPPCVGGNTMLVFRGSRGVSLWTVDTQAQIPSPLPVDIGSGPVVAGDNSPAIFFLEHYFHQVPNTLESLTPLVAHAVLMAKGEYVEGLQIGICTKKTFRTLTEDELKSYVELSGNIDSGILERLLSVQQSKGGAQ